jgi:hypothetical protein
MLSNYAKNIAEKFKLTIGGVRKMITSLGPRKKYIPGEENNKPSIVDDDEEKEPSWCGLNC